MPASWLVTIIHVFYVSKFMFYIVAVCIGFGCQGYCCWSITINTSLYGSKLMVYMAAVCICGCLRPGSPACPNPAVRHLGESWIAQMLGVYQLVLAAGVSLVGGPSWIPCWPQRTTRGSTIGHTAFFKFQQSRVCVLVFLHRAHLEQYIRNHTRARLS